MKVSIIIPVYNVAAYIEKCLYSVLNQSYKDIEVILVDDCGTDDSMQIAEGIISSYVGSFKIRILHHTENKGLSAARNTGIKASVGDYLFFLDSDDTLPVHSIEQLVVKEQQYTGVDFVIGAVKTIGRNFLYTLLCKEYLSSNNEILVDYLLFKWNVMACNKLIRKDFLIQNQLFFAEGKLHEDLDFTLRLALSANSMACCYQVTYNYLVRPDSISSYRKMKNFEDELYMLSLNFEKLKNKQKVASDNHLVSEYVIELTYIYILHLIKERNPDISVKQKLYLIREMLDIKYTLKCSPSRKIFYIKNLILHLSPSLLFKVLGLYIRFRKLD